MEMDLAPFLQEFVDRIERMRKEIEARPEQREHFVDTRGKTRPVRSGNFSDFLKMEQDIATRAADHVLSEMREEMQVKTISREDRHHAIAAEKLVVFYHTQAKLFAEYAEAVDDPGLSKLASIMGEEFPYLKEMYDAYMKRFAESNIKE